MKKTLGITILVLGVVLLIVGFSTTVPAREFSTDSIPAYYGEMLTMELLAGIRGGEIAGTTGAKAVYFGTGSITVAIGLALIAFDYDEKKKEQTFENVAKTKKEETLQEVSELLPKI